MDVQPTKAVILLSFLCRPFCWDMFVCKRLLFWGMLQSKYKKKKMHIKVQCTENSMMIVQRRFASILIYSMVCIVYLFINDFCIDVCSSFLILFFFFGAICMRFVKINVTRFQWLFGCLAVWLAGAIYGWLFNNAT